MTSDLSMLRTGSNQRRVFQERTPGADISAPAAPQFSVNYYGPSEKPSSNIWALIEDIAGKTAKNMQEKEAQRDEQAQAVSYVADRESAIEVQATQLRSDYEGNPEGFSKAWDTFSGQVLSQTASPFQESIKNTLGRAGSRTYGVLENQRKALTQLQAKSALEDTIATKRNVLLGMMDEGQFGTEEFDTIMDEYVSSVRSSANMGYISREEADIAVDKTLTDIQEKTVINMGVGVASTGKYNQVAAIYKDMGDTPATRKMLDEITKTAYFEIGGEEKRYALASQAIEEEQKVLGQKLFEMIYNEEDVGGFMDEYGSEISRSDFKAALAASEGLVPYQSDVDTLYTIDQLSPDQAIEEAKSAFAQGRLSRADLKNTIEQADAAKKQPMTYAERAVQNVSSSLKTPPYMKKQAAAMTALRSYSMFDLQNWLSQNSEASDADIDKKVKSIQKTARAQILDAMPKAYGIDAPKSGITLDNVGMSAKKVMDDYKAGKISHARMMQAAEDLDTWQQFLKDNTYAGFSD